MAYTLGMAALVGAIWFDILPDAVMLKIADGVNKFSLLAIPFFVLAGAIMAEGGIAMRLINFASLFVGLPSAAACRWSISSPRPSSAGSRVLRSPTPRRSVR